MSRFTVIGAGGFIGARLAARLRAEGHEVLAPDRHATDYLSQDLGRVFYCAGLTGDFMVRPFDTVEAHVALLARLLREGRFERLVYLSSTRVYDSQADGVGREDAVLALDPHQPRNVYDLSKALGENLCLAWSGGRAAVARLSNVLALDEEASGFLPDLMRRARREREIVLASSPAGARDYVLVDDALEGLIRLEARGGARIVNVAAGRNISNQDLVDLFARHGWRLVLTGQDAPPAPPVCDVTRLRGLGVEPQDMRTVLETLLSSAGFYQGPPQGA